MVRNKLSWKVVMAMGVLLMAPAAVVGLAWMPVWEMGVRHSRWDAVDLMVLAGVVTTGFPGVSLFLGGAWRAVRKQKLVKRVDATLMDQVLPWAKFETPVALPYATPAAQPAQAAPAASAVDAAQPPKLTREQMLATGEMAVLRAQVDRLCKTLGQGSTAALRADVLDDSVAMAIHRAAAFAHLTTRVAASESLAADMALMPRETPDSTLPQLQGDLVSIANGLQWLAHHWLQSAVNLDTLQVELSLQVTLTAPLSPLERLHFLSSLLLTSVSNLTAALAEAYLRMRGDLSPADARVPRLRDRALHVRPWPPRASNDRLPTHDLGDLLEPIPQHKLN